jgi:cytochrome c biogenesis protein CcmG/thiol:disulfide interchange protein DsbE
VRNSRQLKRSPRPRFRDNRGGAGRAAIITLGILVAVSSLILLGWAVSLIRSQENSPRDFEIVMYSGDGAVDGTTRNFKDLFNSGRPLVLNFWAGECPPCRAEMPAFQAIYGTHKSSVDFIGVDVGVFTGLGTRQTALELLEQLDITYPTGAATSGDSIFSYSITSMPTTIFFGADGKVFRRWEGSITGPQMESVTNEMLR